MMCDMLSEENIKKLQISYGIPAFFQLDFLLSKTLVETYSNTVYSCNVNPHSHDFYELIYCISGHLCYLLGTKRYEIHPGDIIMIPPGVMHSAFLPEEASLETPFRKYVIDVSTSLLAFLQQYFSSESLLSAGEAGVLSTSGTSHASLEQYFSRGIKLASAKSAGWKMNLCGNTVSLIADLFRALEEQSPLVSTELSRNDLPEKMMEWIQANLSAGPTLSDAARHFYLSEKTIGNLFRKNLGLTFHQYVHQCRMIEAKALILQNTRLEDVGTLIGFSDYSSFYRAFKAEFGISPRQYRQLANSI